ncbi:MAG TPA: hypothetical protein V6C97_10050 [Oculatellaceae cyanobacterium]
MLLLNLLSSNELDREMTRELLSKDEKRKSLASTVSMRSNGRRIVEWMLSILENSRDLEKDVWAT